MLWLQFEGKIHNTLAQLQGSATLPVSDWNLPLWTQKSKQKVKLKTSKNYLQLAVGGLGFTVLTSHHSELTVLLV